MAVQKAIVAASLCLSVGASCGQGSGLTILSRNDLDSLPTNGTAAILVHQPKAYNASSCALINETPWDPDAASSATVLSGLAYQSFTGRFAATQRYWVAASESDACRSIDAAGLVTPAPCDTKLPIICTNSAPVSTDFFADKSESKQIVQHIGNETTIRGWRDAHSFRFEGIRYAAQPPRFAHSKLADLPVGETKALDYGKRCPQLYASAETVSEECHFVNVWTPHLPPPSGESKAQLRPVAIYIHGGGFQYGNGSQPSAIGSNMASRGDVVVVAIQYRLGTLGFLPLQKGAKGGEVGSGNYGIGDIVNSIEWVHKYIHHFGGDASQITIFGQSAGATAVQLLLTSPKTVGRFQRASMMTAWQGYPARGFFQWVTLPTYAEVMQMGPQNIPAGFGCAGLSADEEVECMRKADATKLSNFLPIYSYPIVDYNYLDAPSVVVNATGRASNITILTGTTRDEGGKAIVVYPYENDTFATFAKRALSNYPLAPGVLPPLRPEQFNTDFEAQSKINTSEAILNATISLISGGEYTCLEHSKVYSASASGAFGPTYLYVLNRTQMMHNPDSQNPDWLFPLPSPERPNGDPDKEYFKAHTGEVLPIFGTASRRGLVDRDGRDWAFSRLMQDRWTSFFRTGDPNPDEKWLEVRGYESTLERVRAGERWEIASPQKRTNAMWLQWDSFMTELQEKEGCRAIGLPLDVLEAK